MQLHPPTLCTTATAICMQLARYPVFVTAAAECGHTRPDDVRSMMESITRRTLLPLEGPVSQRSLLQFTEALDAERRRQVDALAEFGEAPYELLDPLLCTVMVDPVRTPSGHVFDRHRCVHASPC